MVVCTLVTGLGIALKLLSNNKTITLQRRLPRSSFQIKCINWGKFEAMPISLGFDGSPCFGTWPFSRPSSHREKGMPLCPAYGVVKGFFSVVVLMWLRVAYQM